MRRTFCQYLTEIRPRSWEIRTCATLQAGEITLPMTEWKNQLKTLEPVYKNKKKMADPHFKYSETQCFWRNLSQSGRCNPAINMVPSGNWNVQTPGLSPKSHLLKQLIAVKCKFEINNQPIIICFCYNPPRGASTKHKNKIDD